MNDTKGGSTRRPGGEDAPTAGQGMPSVAASVGTALLRSLPGHARALVRSGAQPDQAHPPTLPTLEPSRSGVRLDRSRVTAYARVCGFGLRSTIPVTYPYVAAFPLHVALLTSPGFPFPALGTVHLTNALTWTRAIELGERLDITVRAEDLRAHRRGHAFDVVTTVSSSNEAIWISRSAYLARGNGDASAPTTKLPDVAEVPPGPVTWRIPSSQGREYAAVSGDYNPIHLSSVSARAFGLKNAIAHGMWSYARVLAHLGPQVPLAGTSSVWFRDPIGLPSTVRLGVSRDGSTVALYAAKTGRTHLVATVS